jgi:hypothetical protein
MAILLRSGEEPTVATGLRRHIDDSPRSGVGISLMTADLEGVTMGRYLGAGCQVGWEERT